jgi:hypothetical protein
MSLNPLVLKWSSYFNMRKSMKRLELGSGFLTGFLSLQTSSFYFLTIAKYDPTNMILGMVREIVIDTFILLAHVT